jgi:hypothetical protein
MAIGALNVTSPPSAPILPAADVLEKVRQDWIRSQSEYFRRTAAAHRRSHHRLEAITNWLFGATLVVTSLAAAWQWWFGSGETTDHTMHGLIVFIALALTAGALAHGWTQKRAYLAIARRYTVQADLFERAEVQAGEYLRSGDRAAMQRLILQLGREALAENGDWLLLHRDRPLEVPRH